MADERDAALGAGVGDELDGADQGGLVGGGGANGLDAGLGAGGGAGGPGGGPQEALSLNRPRILLMGPRQSGKTSIQRVLFTKMSPHETLFLGHTDSLSIKFVANNPFVQFEIWDFPADVNLSEGIMFADQLLSPDLIFGNCAALAFIIDAQDDPSSEALTKLHEIVSVARHVNPDMNYEVFIHKVDGDLFLSEDHKIEVQRDIQEQVELELEEVSDEEISFSFYLTSIYDHSIYEAFSKVVHKLIPQLPAMENLLNILIASCEIEKAFLFDVVSKLYIATDHNPVDISSYELCSDMIDVVIDTSCIYGMSTGAPLNANGAALAISASTDNLIAAGGDGAASEAAALGDAAGASAADTGVAVDDPGEAGAGVAAEGSVADGDDVDEDREQKLENLAFDRQSSSLIRLNNNMILYLKNVASYLALVCMVRSQNYEKQGLIDYNVECFRKALEELFRPSPA
ncbi:Ras-related GTP-binding protein C [Hondaea fermentalgiana]|uniref:Ras-related GTP-binding protein C n=1 Tax=Hondaea fermentalgiana TaxID=2315210 RepID=A0A2R5GFG3_9STRA|nr:Ras-related GTP-binding protein C [Hondaea fermentalgiana]|eukprot:GBG29069.1 Ras-related GTP-binding protein C [Hondaea fermentalgiana]